MDSTAPPDSAATEARRLEALHRLNILDTPAEVLLDSLTRSAAAACGTPMAMLNLIDAQRQWTKAQLGLDGFTQMPREQSICTVVVDSRQYVEIPDTRADPRTSGKQCVVAEPRIRFYAGAPLRTPDGHVLGSLAVLDRAARAGLDAGQRSVLEELARAVVQSLLLRQAAHITLQSSSEHMFRELSEACPIGIFHSDASGQIIYANPECERIFGRPRTDLLQEGWVASVHPDDRPRTVAAWQKAAARGARFDHTYRLLRGDGALRHVRVRAQAVRLPDGSPGGYVGSLVDITVEVGARVQLQASNDFLARAEQIAGVGGWRFTLATRELLWTGQVRRIFEVPPEYVPRGAEPLRFFPPEAQQRIRAAGKAALRHGAPWDLLVPMTTARGRQGWVRTIGQVEFHDGRPQALVGALQDVTESQLARAALERSQERLHRALDGSGLALWDLDVPHETIYLSETWSVMLGGEPRETRCTADEVIGLVPPEDLPRIQAALEPVLHGSASTYLVQHRVRRRDGGLIWIHSEGRVAERDAHGAPLRMVGTNRDITQGRKAEEELRIARDAADAANRAKSHFLATMSHEIRTPLNGIIGLTRLMLDENLSGEVRRHADLVDRSAQSLLALVNDILDFSKIEAGQMEIESVPFNLHELLEDLATLFRLRATEKSLLFRVRVHPEVPRLVQGDPTRIRQVLVNLLGNALKFTQAGWIGLSVKATPESAAHVLQFTVSDTGMGIPEDVVPQLFSAFTQADSSTSRRFGGTGLGLSIVRQLVDLMGGTVQVASAPGKGSRFTVTLPLLAAQEAPPASMWEDLPPSTAGARILVAEDNTTNQVVAFGMLRKLGYGEVTLANDGREAFDLALSEHFDAILMDCQMPEMDGYEATRRLRAAGCTTPVIAMTANAIKGDRERCLEAGMNDYLTKPMDLKVLRAMLARWTGAQPSRLAELPLFAADAMHSRFGGDSELERIALDTFRQSTPPLLAKLRAAVEADNRQQIGLLAHSAKGAGSMICAERYAAIAGLLEEHAARAAAEDLARMADEMERAFAAFDAEVRERV